MAETKPIHWVLTDHMCRSCGGRILKSVANVGMSPGGNPIHRCASCGRGGASFSSSSCWCEFALRGQQSGAYRCLSFSILEEKPHLLEAFLACGCDPKAGQEVGIVLEADLRRLADKGAPSNG